MLQLKPFSKSILGTLGFALWAQVALAGSAPDRTALASALKDLVIAEHALNVAEQDYLDVRRANALSATEEKDYKGFIEALRQSLERTCARVERLDASMVADRESCQSVAGAGPVSAPTPEQTRSEKVATIDAELRASMAEFDGLLQREQLELEKTARNPGSQDADSAGSGQGGQAGDGGQSGNRGDASGAVPEKQASPGEAPVDEPGDRPGQAEDEARGTVGPPDSGPGAAIPDDIPEAQDDDIVARQLREAAENEPDPELRERLWEEYRRYKESLE